MMRGCLLALLSVVVVGCATVQPPAPAVEEPPSGPVAEVPAAPQIIDQRMMLPREELVTLMADDPGRPTLSPTATVRTVTQRSTMQPRDASYQGAIAIFDYCEGCIYTVYVSVQGTVHLEFGADEQVYVQSGLRPVHWFVQWKDEPPEVSRHFLITPQEVHVSGRLTVITNRGAYYIDLKSRERLGMTAVRWRHPPSADDAQVHAR